MVQLRIYVLVMLSLLGLCRGQMQRSARGCGFFCRAAPFPHEQTVCGKSLAHCMSCCRGIAATLP